MNLLRLRQFIAIAEELHFGRAATRLGIAQPALTQSLKRLEAELDAVLLDRSRRHVQLTRAGAVLLEHGRSLIAQVELCEADTRRASASVDDRLRIGHSVSPLHDLLPRWVEKFHARWPAVKVELEGQHPEDLHAGLQDGRFDLVLTTHRGPTHPHETMVPVERLEIMVAVPRRSPLARRNQLRLHDLDDHACIATHDLRKSIPFLHQALARICRDAGFKPEVTQRTRSMDASLQLVARNLGYAFLPQGTVGPGHPNVVMRPVREFRADLYVDVVVAWRERHLSTPARLFLKEIETTTGIRMPA